MIKLNLTMEDLTQSRTVTKQFLITPSNFGRYKEYIYEKLKEMEGFVLDDNNGFLKYIVEIKSIRQSDINRQTFDGSIIFEVDFVADFVFIEKNKQYKMKVIKVDNGTGILLTNNGPVISIIKNYQEVDEVYKRDDSVDVEIEGIEYIYKSKVIKSVGKLV